MNTNDEIVFSSVEEYADFIADVTHPDRGWVIADRNEELCPNEDGELYEFTDIHFEDSDGVYMGVLTFGKSVHGSSPMEMFWTPFSVTLEGDSDERYSNLY